METWKAIPGYEGLYEASTQGRIRTAYGKTTSSARFEKRVWKQRVLKPKIQTNSYGRKDYRVELWKDGSHKTFLVARLVALTFCDGYFDGATVNHINGNSTDNSAPNLEWVSRSENIRKGYSDGLYRSLEKQVLCVETGKRYKSMAEAGRQIGTSCSNISSACRNERRSTAGGYHWVVI